MGQPQCAPAVIRRLTDQDVDLFRSHLLRLEPQARRLRFAMAVSDSFLERYAAQAFAQDAVLFGSFQQGALRAVAELRPLGREEAEAAFSTESPYERRGIGTALFAELVREARRRKFRRLYMTCLVQNRAMQALARKFAAELHYDADGVLAVLDAALGPATWAETEGSPQPLFSTATVRLNRWWREKVHPRQ